MIPIALRLVSVTALLVGVLASSLTLRAQSSPAPRALEFDVASVKQNKSGRDSHSNFSLDSGNLYSTVNEGDAFSPSGGYFSATSMPLWRYIVFAYKLSGTQEMALRFSYFSGLSSKVPEWVSGGFDVSAEKFDIEARAAGNPTRDQMRLMMQSLLADRFKLVVHHEIRQVPVFALVLDRPGKTGPNLQPHLASDSCSAEPSTEHAPNSPSPSWSAAVGELPIVCGVIAHVPSTTPGQLQLGGRNVTLALLASSLPTMTGLATIPRPVIDRTGLSGTFDFTFGGWASQPASDAGEPGPSFAEVLKQQLGLRLERQNGPVDILVINHIEHPTEN